MPGALVDRIEVAQCTVPHARLSDQWPPLLPLHHPNLKLSFALGASTSRFNVVQHFDLLDAGPPLPGFLMRMKATHSPFKQISPTTKHSAHALHQALASSVKRAVPIKSFDVLFVEAALGLRRLRSSAVRPAAQVEAAGLRQICD
jgi:hypothetical protein